MANGVDTFATSELFTLYILPFLLVFVIIFAVLERTKVFGSDKKQLNAIAGFVIALIFVGFLTPKAIVANLVLFLVVALVIMLVFLMLYGFAASDMKDGLKLEKWMKNSILGIVFVAVIIAVLWASGYGSGGELIERFFYQPWSGVFWTNALFIVVIAAAVGFVLKSTKSE
jgi:hypothetical protein